MKFFEKKKEKNQTEENQQVEANNGSLKSDASSKLENMVKEVYNLIGNLNKMKERTVDIEKNLVQLSEEIKSSKEEVDKIEQVSTNVIEELRKYKEEESKLLEKLNRIGQEYTRLMSEYNDLITKKYNVSESREILKEIEDYKSEMNEYKKRLEELEKNVNDLRRLMEFHKNYGEDIKNLLEKYDREIDKSKNANALVDLLNYSPEIIEAIVPLAKVNKKIFAAAYALRIWEGEKTYKLVESKFGIKEELLRLYIVESITKSEDKDAADQLSAIIRKSS
ncbi:MAG: hypothetical protein N3D78_02060 [Candidatus Aenigmarchaeota archaeon]|nr:hypothetical protein [Candidatus Aenigmarchaeota archaeon]